MQRRYAYADTTADIGRTKRIKDDDEHDNIEVKLDVFMEFKRMLTN